MELASSPPSVPRATVDTARRLHAAPRRRARRPHSSEARDYSARRRYASEASMSLNDTSEAVTTPRTKQHTSRLRQSLEHVNQKLRPRGSGSKGASEIASPPSSQARTASTDSIGQRYEVMMERFQIRRLSSNLSNQTHNGDTATVSDLADHPRLSGTSVSRHAIAGDHSAFVDLAAPPLPSVASIDRSSRLSLYWVWRRVARQLSRHWSFFSALGRVRLVLLVAAYALRIITFPLFIAFYANHDYADAIPLLQVVVETVFAVDFVLMLTANETTPSTSTSTSASRSGCHKHVSWELLTSLPVGTILMFIFGRASVPCLWLCFAFDVAIRRLRLVRVVSRMARKARGTPERRVVEWLLYSRYSHLLRIAWIISGVVLFAHYLACGWRALFFTSALAGSPLEEYVSCMYDVLQLLQGQGVPTTSVFQSAYATVVILLGSIALAIIFGNVAILVANFNANATTYQRKMESVFAVMSKLQLPTPLRERIHQYYEHLWREYESVDGEIVAFSKSLSHSLQLEVVLFKYMELIMHVPFWRSASPDFQKQLMLRLQVRVYLPDDFIIRRGEVGDEFFMINRGVCVLELGPDSFECTTTPLHNVAEAPSSESEASTPGNATCYEPPERVASVKHGRTAQARAIGPGQEDDGADKYTQTLERGQSFGEIALLMNYERTANARAVTYVEMCVLHRVDFQNILMNHPKDRHDVISAMLAKTMANNDANEVWCPLRATVQQVFGDTDRESESEPLSARQAALLISTAINTSLQDESIKFGVGDGLREQLVTLRDQQSPRAVAPKPKTVEATDGRAQSDLTALVLELTREVRSLQAANAELQAMVRSSNGCRQCPNPSVSPPSAVPTTDKTAPRAPRAFPPPKLARRPSSQSLKVLPIDENTPQTTRDDPERSPSTPSRRHHRRLSYGNAVVTTKPRDSPTVYADHLFRRKAPEAAQPASGAKP